MKEGKRGKPCLPPFAPVPSPAPTPLPPPVLRPLGCLYFFPRFRLALADPQGFGVVLSDHIAHGELRLFLPYSRRHRGASTRPK